MRYNAHMQNDWFSLLWERSGESLTRKSKEEFLALLKPKCKNITTEHELLALLEGKRKLRVKLGVDATGAELHLGHAVPLMLLRLFLRAGHEAHFIIGDFTGKIGDPSGRADKRVEQTDAEILRNIKNYKKQISLLLDIKKARIHKNSSWLAKMSLGAFLRVVGFISFGAVSQREDFRRRIETGSAVSLREANYASLMGIDSVHIKADVEVGAIDQLLNFMQVRDIMTGEGMRPEVLCATPLIEGTAGDGRKMSKSFNNYIALGAVAEDQFGLIMRIPDSIVESYFVSFGDIYEHELLGLKSFIAKDPFEAKKQLGMLVVALLHGHKKAQSAREHFERRFSRKEYIPKDKSEIRMSLPSPVFDALVRAFGDEYSRSHIRALLAQGGVKCGDKVLKEHTDLVRDGDTIKVGKRHLFRFYDPR